MLDTSLQKNKINEKIADKKFFLKKCFSFRIIVSGGDLKLSTLRDITGYILPLFLTRNMIITLFSSRKLCLFNLKT